MRVDKHGLGDTPRVVLRNGLRNVCGGPLLKLANRQRTIVVWRSSPMLIFTAAFRRS